MTQPSPAAAAASTPADLYGALFAEVQLRGVFADGKTFADAVPLAAPADIMADYAAISPGAESLGDFVLQRFALPRPVLVPDPNIGGHLRTHIAALWNELARGPDVPTAAGSALDLRHRYLVPGGRFRELYYWDSYFSMLGLVRDGHRALAEDMLEAFTDLIERFGHVPNGSRSYYLGRSQPPFYAAMVDLLPHPDPAVMRRRLAAMVVEHGFWMAGAEGLVPGDRRGRCVAMADGTILNRHWDDRDTPRDESFREDVETSTAAPHRSASEVFRDVRAAAESGWDFSSRWFEAGADLRSIQTTQIVPVDLNAYLHQLEATVARLAGQLYDHRLAAEFDRLARRRRQAISRHLWSDRLGTFCDHDLATGTTTGQLTAAALTPLFVGIASPRQAASTARLVEQVLLAPGGLRTTLVATGEQWDAPNGWAPLQWMAFAGLDRYGHRRLAREIARRWTDMVHADFARTGWLHEKYDVERCAAGGGGEYVPQHGFGWTNGVTAAFIDLLDARELS